MGACWGALVTPVVRCLRRSVPAWAGGGPAPRLADDHVRRQQGRQQHRQQPAGAAGQGRARPPSAAEAPYPGSGVLDAFPGLRHRAPVTVSEDDGGASYAPPVPTEALRLRRRRLGVTVDKASFRAVAGACCRGVFSNRFSSGGGSSSSSSHNNNNNNNNGPGAEACTGSSAGVSGQAPRGRSGGGGGGSAAAKLCACSAAGTGGPARPCVAVVFSFHASSPCRLAAVARCVRRAAPAASGNGAGDGEGGGPYTLLLACANKAGVAEAASGAAGGGGRGGDGGSGGGGVLGGSDWVAFGPGHHSVVLLDGDHIAGARGGGDAGVVGTCWAAPPPGVPPRAVAVAVPSLALAAAAAATISSAVGNGARRLARGTTPRTPKQKPLVLVLESGRARQYFSVGFAAVATTGVTVDVARGGGGLAVQLLSHEVEVAGGGAVCLVTDAFGLADAAARRNAANAANAVHVGDDASAAAAAAGDDSNAGLCIVCMCEPADVLTRPCRHVCLCTACAPRCPRCPLCRLHVTGRVQVEQSGDADETA